MRIELIPINDLIVNPANDRHGKLVDETTAIAWLLNNHEKHMKNLAKDIADQGGLYEIPLVLSENQKYIVHDGNRRVTCIKLLLDPDRAPTVPLQKYFKNLCNDTAKQLQNKIFCQVGTSAEHIDETLYRRHTGSRGGVGTLNWSGRAKHNYLKRKGRPVDVGVAAEIEKLLHENKLLQENEEIPLSNMDRLLSSEKIRGRLGFSYKNNEFKIIDPSNKKQVLAALQRVAKDIIEKNIVLKDLWKLEVKHMYLDKLKKEGILPTGQHSLQRSQSTSSLGVFQKATAKKPLGNTSINRTTLIPKGYVQPSWSDNLQRHRQIWHELQHKLELENHINAIAVLLRVLLELSINNYHKNYLNPENGDSQVNGSLAQRLNKVGEHLNENGKIDEKKWRIIGKFKDGRHMISADTLNLYIHSEKFEPTRGDVTSIWDNLSDIIKLCLAPKTD